MDPMSLEELSPRACYCHVETQHTKHVFAKKKASSPSLPSSTVNSSSPTTQLEASHNKLTPCHVSSLPTSDKEFEVMDAFSSGHHTAIHGGQGGSGGRGVGGAGGTGEGPNWNVRVYGDLSTCFSPPGNLEKQQKAVSRPKSSNLDTVEVQSCHPSSPIFEGRQNILEKMEAYFRQNSGKQHIYLLYGPGGIGKTQIALKFLEEFSSHFILCVRFSQKFMIDASSASTLETGLKNIAISFGIGSAHQDALRWFTGKRDKWMLFFDNADDPTINLNVYLPHCHHGNIIITSRNPALMTYAESSTCVTEMTEESAVNLLLNSSCQDIQSPENRKLAADIVQALWNLPLALVHAGAFILETGSLDGYLSIYLSNKEELLSNKGGDQSHDNYQSQYTVYSTVQISFEKLSSLSAQFLLLCSCLHCEGISEKMFSGAVGYEFPSWGPSEEELQNQLEFLSNFKDSSGEWKSLQFLKMIKEIKAYSLINIDPLKKSFSIHPLVYEWCQMKAKDV
ncbi:P-loop containing nucleoside triphosphate hydrolase protein, partial [Mycena olivaceomarginata]